MNILFLGGHFTSKVEKEILDNSNDVVQYAANKFQMNLLQGFSEIPNVHVTSISAPFIGAYPQGYKTLYYKPTVTHDELYKMPIRYVSFNNLWGYKTISRKFKLIRKTTKVFMEDGPYDVIMVYSPHTPFMEAALQAKKKTSAHICLVVPDLPQYMNLSENKSKIYELFKSIDIKKFEELNKYVDSFVLLTEAMKDALSIGNRPYTVIEGIVNSTEISRPEPKTCNNKIILYTGTLNKKFGIVNLVDAFSLIEDENIELKICGRGDSEDYIKELASKDSRIKFLGQVTNQEAVKLQQEATILVNPRQNNEEYTKYSFPSKNMEYLLTGKPVIAYKLDGIPDEYNEYFYYVKDDSARALKEKIVEVINMPFPHQLKTGMEAQNFVLQKKNPKASSNKIIKMISYVQRK